MREQGRIEVRRTKKGISGTLFWEDKHIPVPPFFKLDLELNGRDCEFIREKGQIKKIIIEGKELPRKDQKPIQKSPNVQRHISDYKDSSGSKRSSSRNTIPDSFDINKTKLPQDTRKTMLTEIDNFYLKLNRGAHYFIQKKESDEGKREKKEVPTFFHKEKANSFALRPKFEDDLFFKDLNSRQLSTVKKFLGISSNNDSPELLRVLNYTPDWRMVVGLGQESIYETSLTLHYIYGFPYIPGQAIKGIVRNWVIYSEFNDDENAALNKDDFRYVFGRPKNKDQCATQGRVIFFDAFPVKQPHLEFDIMNPHYQNYYSGKNPPTDNYNPVPVFFLTVASTPFQFIIGAKAKHRKLLAFNGETKSLLDWIAKWLTDALAYGGIGAKTAVGYGYMKREF